jgi:hypothetical protein
MTFQKRGSSKDRTYVLLSKCNNITNSGSLSRGFRMASVLFVAAFVVPDVKDLLAYSEMVRKNTLEYLKGLKPKDFDKKVNLPPPTVAGNAPPRRPPFEPIVGLMLMHEVTELAGHAGEISYLRGLQWGLDK